MLKLGPRYRMIKTPRHGMETFGGMYLRNEHPDSLKLSKLAEKLLSLEESRCDL